MNSEHDLPDAAEAQADTTQAPASPSDPYGLDALPPRDRGILLRSVLTGLRQPFETEGVMGGDPALWQRQRPNAGLHQSPPSVESDDSDNEDS